VLPELFLPAYHPPTLAADPEHTHVLADAAGAIADSRLDPVRDVAAGRGVVAIVGAAVTHEDGRRTCSSVVVDASGTVLAAYDKQQLWGPDENALFTPGSTGASLTLDGWQIGLGICYDGCFPEHGRAAAAAGAHAYALPSGYLVGSEHRRDLYYAARALDNGMYVIFANSVGGEGDWRFNGGAAIYEPEGRPLVRGDDRGEAVLVADLDPAVIQATRTAHSMLADRRGDLAQQRIHHAVR
jgi:predicted amidohydrolase